ncbi:MAG: MBL fold metallo-hydrolase [Thermoplasmata archaeon]
MVEGSPSPPHPFSPRDPPADAPTVRPTELAAMLAATSPPLLLDIRSEAERETARLPGGRPIPAEAVAQRWRELPPDRPIVVVDHTGPLAVRVAAFLRARGFAHVAALDGGIDRYAREVDPTLPRYEGATDRPALAIVPVPRTDTGCLSYVVADMDRRIAAVIDPPRSIEPVLARLREGGLSVGAIVETHTHADHLAGHGPLHARTGAPIYLGRRSPAQFPHATLEEGQAIELGTATIRVLETPGHTRDHLSLRVGPAIFTGDTLLLGSVGRTDLGDGDPERLYESLTEKILREPESTWVYPAHFGPHHALGDRWVSTIGVERATNEALQCPDRASFLRYMAEGWPPKPADFDAIVRANLEE